MKYGKGEDVITSTSCTVTKDLRHQSVKAGGKYILDWKSLSVNVKRMRMKKTFELAEEHKW